MPPPPPLKTFIIYSSLDRDLRTELERHLLPLVDLGWLEVWSDKAILPGEVWDKAIKKELLQADLFLLLVSVDFYNSGYIREEEFKTAVARLESGDSLVIPVIVRPCPWKFDPFIKSLQVLPSGGKPVTDTDHWNSRDKAWNDVVEQIGERVERLREEQMEAKNRAAEEARKRREQAEAEKKRLAEEVERKKRDEVEAATLTAESKQAKETEDILKKSETEVLADEVPRAKETRSQRKKREQLEALIITAKAFLALSSKG